MNNNVPNVDGFVHPSSKMGGSSFDRRSPRQNDSLPKFSDMVDSNVQALSEQEVANAARISAGITGLAVAKDIMSDLMTRFGPVKDGTSNKESERLETRVGQISQVSTLLNSQQRPKTSEEKKDEEDSLEDIKRIMAIKAYKGQQN